MFENETRPEQALLVALDTGEYDAQASLDELAELTRTAGAEPAFFLTRSARPRTPPPAWAPAWLRRPRTW